MRGAATAVALTVMAGCSDMSAATGGLAGTFASLGASGNATNRGIRTLALLGGEVRARGPEGYCVDQRASDARGGFAVMAGCALLSTEAVVMPRPDGLILVQFGAPDTASVAGNEDTFAAFLTTEQGRAILAGDGDMTNVAEVATIADRGGVLARFEDTSGLGFDGTAGPQWRGFLDVQGRLTSVSVLSFERNPLSRSEGERLLVVSMAQLAEVNGPPAVVAIEN